MISGIFGMTVFPVDLVLSTQSGIPSSTPESGGSSGQEIGHGQKSLRAGSESGPRGSSDSGRPSNRALAASAMCLRASSRIPAKLSGGRHGRPCPRPRPEASAGRAAARPGGIWIDLC